MTTQPETAVGPVNREGNIFRKTNSHRGRQVVITPSNSSMQHLCYGRILLDSNTPSAQFNTGSHETGLICLDGEASLNVNGEAFTLGKYDSVYIPPKCQVTVSGQQADLAEFSAEVKNSYPLQIVRHSDVTADKSLHFITGNPGSTRTIHVMIGKNVQAGRIMAGLTVSEPGNWTSWPPHEHAKMLEEMYVYTTMPAPGFGLQFVYTNTQEPELVTVVREGDAVLMPRGYHPNVAAPGHKLSFLWAMAAHREVEDRQYGVVNVQPEFSAGGSGLEASRK